MKKIVITGGCHSGKTTILNALKQEFPHQVLVVKEAATLLLDNGFPRPGTDLPWSEEWQAAFQSAILPLQQSLENTSELMAQHQQHKVIVFDRGILDGAAYTPGGVREFCRIFHLNLHEVLLRYDKVIHLESLSTANPEEYGKSGNQNRFEPLERAQMLEMATREAWSQHPQHIFVHGRRTIEEKTSEVLNIIAHRILIPLLAER